MEEIIKAEKKILIDESRMILARHMKDSLYLVFKVKTTQDSDPERGWKWVTTIRFYKDGKVFVEAGPYLKSENRRIFGYVFYETLSNFIFNIFKRKRFVDRIRDWINYHDEIVSKKSVEGVKKDVEVQDKDGECENKE
ncbi:hypothetical protein Mfer_0950 [Methanothermus fervidus DSM 2088]|uniref:Uncharacterized protein n=1 Tax=Methanothermus fervidus (strain ATCC 43054 / DSM 2088 / JCM 10308 / V24 S) TaxID=523846 RepID=E3GVY2_METFV|nr:hypothetical protein [Methanothermus fervidus]ADP77747.1 hypothetical protein Mfer_0950 [Methanothermus fervidus DSM 2088]